MRYPFLFFLLVSQFSFAQKDSIVLRGQALTYANKHAEAITYFKQHLIDSQTTVQEIELLFGLADVYKLQLKFADANTYYLQAYKHISKIKNIQLEFLYYVKMSEFYRKRTLYKDMIKMLDKADQLLKRHTITDANLAKFYSRKAALFTEHLIRADSTLLYAQKSLQYATKIGDKDNIFYARLEIACLYEREGNDKKALKEFESLILYAQKNKLVQNEADGYIAYISTLIKNRQMEKALSESLKAADFSKKNNLLYNENIFVIKIYEIYKELQDYKKANEYLEYRQKLSERYYKFEHNKFLFELEEQYKLSDKEQEITIANLELANKNEQLSTNRIRLLVIVSLFLVAIAGALAIGYFLRKTKSTNKELQFLSQQNEFLLSEANHRINNNLQLIIILISVQLSKIPENEGQEMKKILKKIGSIATLHRHLYQSPDKRNVNSYKYLQDIHLSFSDLFLENQINAHFDIEAIELSADVSMYLGLLLTELCINSIKYAFVNQDLKKITFTLKKESDSFYFCYHDNGAGMSNADVKPKLIDQLCRQLRISYTLENNQGFAFSFIKEIK